jgi:hypothetical protein
MHGLNDKIFLPISIFSLNIALAVFQFVLVCAVGAAFAVYSKYGGEYANSVRWTRSAGYLEMIKTIRGSRKASKIPKSAKVALVVGLLATAVASFLDKGIARFVNPATRVGSYSTRTLVISPQLTSAIRKSFSGWSFVVPRDGNITGIMEKALNSSLAIPDAESDKTYTPVTADYTIKCADFSLSLGALNITNGGCARFSPDFLSNPGVEAIFKLTERSPNRWSIQLHSKTVPFNVRIAALESLLQILGEDGCSNYESTRLRPYGDVQDGISTFPTTSTTICALRSGDRAVMSLTSTRFTFANKEYNTNLTSTIFTDTSDELLLAMEESFKTKIIPPTNLNVELWIEIRKMNNSVDMLVCSYDTYQLPGGLPVRNVECVYYNINGLVVSQQVNPKIKEAARLPRDNWQGTFMILDHPPSVHNRSAPISLEKKREDTAAVTDYVARLGNNVYTDYKEGKFFAEYDVKDIESGLEVPFWVLVFSGIILIFSLILWQLTDWIIESPYRSSLYHVMGMRMASRTDTPMLLRTKLEPHEPLELEGVELLPYEHSRN